MYTTARAWPVAKTLFIFSILVVSLSAARAEEDVKNENPREDYSLPAKDSEKPVKTSKSDSHESSSWNADRDSSDRERIR